MENVARKLILFLVCLLYRAFLMLVFTSFYDTTVLPNHLQHSLQRLSSYINGPETE